MHLKRPVWVWCSSTPHTPPVELRVFQYDGEYDVQQVTPIRIAHAGGSYFALVEQSHDRKMADMSSNLGLPATVLAFLLCLHVSDTHVTPLLNLVVTVRSISNCPSRCNSSSPT